MNNQKILALLFVFWVFGCLLLLENNDLNINQDAKYNRNTQPLHLSNNFLTPEWNYTWGGAEDDFVYGVAVDSLDNIYITGGTESFGALDEDIFLLKFNSMGVLQWNHTWGGVGSDCAYGVAIDSFDNIYVSGDTDSFGVWDICLLKFNSMGVLQWNYTWGGAGYDSAYGVAIDSSDNIYLTGGTDSFGAINGDICFLKLNNMGVLQWNYTWGGAGYDTGNALAIDSADNIYITGRTGNFGVWDICLLKFNSMGVLQWNHTWGGVGSDFADGVAIDSLDNIYVSGVTTSFGAINGDICLLKFNSMGVLQWNYTWGGAGRENAPGLTIDSSDNIYLSGGTESFGAIITDICLLKFNSIGVLQWNYTWGGAGRDSAFGVAIDSLGNIYITGWTSSFGALGYDIFLVKLNDSTQQPSKEVPLIIILIAIFSTAAGIGVTTIAISLFRKRKHAIPEE